MRKSLRQIERKQPKCANCNIHCANNENRTFSDKLFQFQSLPPNLANTQHSKVSKDCFTHLTDTIGGDAGVRIKEEVVDPDDFHEDDDFLSMSIPMSDDQEVKKSRIRKKTTIFDALLKLFEKEWKLEKDLLISTMKDKENLILCVECSSCLSRLYEWYTRFIKLALDSRKESYLAPIVCQTRNNSYAQSILKKVAGKVESTNLSEPLSSPCRTEASEETPIFSRQRKYTVTSKASSNTNKVNSDEGSAEKKEIEAKQVPKKTNSNSKQLHLKNRQKTHKFNHFKPAEPVSGNDEEGVDDSNEDRASTTDKGIAASEKNCLDFKCHLCRKQFSDNSELRLHLVYCSHKSNKSVGEINNPEIKTEEILESFSDPDFPETEKNNETKLPTKKSKRKPIQRVGIRGKYRKKLKTTVISYVCAEDGCAVVVQTKDDYLSHLSTVHGKTDVDLIMTMSNPNTHVCLICNLMFTSEKDLESHCSLKHIPSIKLRSHSCSECEKTFVSKHDLKHHGTTHFLPMSYACDQCDFRTRRPQELVRHVKLIHLQEKNFFCPICNKGYALKWQLNDHARIHKDERTFPCTEPGCPKSFRTSSNLRQHLELHRGAKYVCHICGQSYSRKAYLRLHVNGTHLMLPLPPSQQRNQNSPRRQRHKSTKPPKQKVKQSKVKISFEKMPINYVSRSPPQRQYLPAAITKIQDDEENFIMIKSQPEEEEEGIEKGIEDEYNNHDTLEDFDMTEEEHDETMHVQLGLETPEAENILSDGVELTTITPNQFTLAQGQQLVCYPMGNLEMVQRYPMTIATEGNTTFYITTAPAQPHGEEDGTTALSVFNPFTEFMALQQ